MTSSAVEVANLTPAQTPIWIGQRLHAGSPLYNMAFAFVFAGELDAERFAAAWRRVAEASDALKTRIVEDASGARRIEADRAAPTRLLAEPLFETADAFRDWCRSRCAEPLRLDGDLADSVLVRIGAGETGWYLNQHHLITDAWSTRLLYRSVARAYEGLATGGSEEETPGSLYYPTAASLQPSREARADALGHWASRRNSTTLPLYGFDGAPTGTASQRLTLEVDATRSRALDALAKSEGFMSLSEDLSRLVVFATLLCGWLHRVSGRRSLTIDQPVGGRPTASAKRTPGLFIEMFPFAVEVEPEDSFRTLGAKCLQEAMDLLRYGLPGTGVTDGGTASNVVLNYVPGAFGPFAGLPATVEWMHPGAADSVHALRLQVHDFSGNGRYVLHFDFNESVLPERLRRRALKQFETLLSVCLEDPDRPIAAVDIRVEEERSALAALNAPTDAPQPERTVSDMFADQADRTPDRVALRQGGSELSFGELSERVEALAVVLLESGVEPGDRVAIRSSRSIDAVVGILATLRARAAYVPIEPGVSVRRLERLLRDSGARLVLAGGSAGDVSTGDVPVLSIVEGVLAGHGRVPESPGPGLVDLAYLIYTSGSSGQPKGVLVEHSGLADYLGWAARKYVRGDRLTFPLFTSLAFDLTVTSLFLPLVTGGTLEIYPESGGPVDTALADVVRANAVDVIKLTPSHLGLLVRMGVEISRIRRMIVGGEALASSLAATVTRQLGETLELYNEYGPTEAVVGCVAHRYDPRRDRGATVPIGRPADRVEVEILDPRMYPVPEGVPGELWVSRYGLARGYHDRPELTAERFQRHPERADRRRYRTGDLVRQLENGELEYLGRVDRQVKVSGYRVEPAEIEAAMLAVPGVEQCAVVADRRTLMGAAAVLEMLHCVRCGLPSNYPGVVFDEAGVCDKCLAYAAIREHAEAYFGQPDDLRRIFAESAADNGSEYDCLMLVSGGKDSTYALCRLVEMGFKVYAFTLDNGFISDSAKENIRAVAAQLEIPVELATTPAMNEIFRDSLLRFSNVCNGCFKTIYTLSLQRAQKLGIPIIVTGLSRGQMFETRLTEEMFRDGRRSPAEVDAAVLAARKLYHRVPDAVSRLLDVGFLQDDRVFEQVRFVDFYRYVDVGLDEVYAYLEEKVPWVRPRDTGRSTNCLINDAGIFVHQRERGFHNYALPYSWDVRLGHKDREAALDELDDAIDEDSVREMLDQVGYDEEPAPVGEERTVLHGFYVGPEELPHAELNRLLAERLPPPMIPGRFHHIESIPLTANGKIDEGILLRAAAGQSPEAPYRAPEGPVEEFLASLWRERLGTDRVGADDSFFELGGTSLVAMEVMIRLCREYDIDLPLETLFTHPTLGGLARIAEERILADVPDDGPALVP